MASLTSESNGRVRKKEKQQEQTEGGIEEEEEREMGKVIDGLVQHRAHNSVTQEPHCSSLSDLLLPAHPPCLMNAVTSTHYILSNTLTGTKHVYCIYKNSTLNNTIFTVLVKCVINGNGIVL